MKTIDDIRTDNLKALVQQHGGTSRFADAIGKGAAQVSQWVNRSANSITGRPRVISTASCRTVEEHLALPTGWMDKEHSDMSTEAPPTREAAAPSNRYAGFETVPMSFGATNPAFVNIRMVTLRLSAGIQGFRTDSDTGPDSELSLSVHWMERKGLIPEKLIALRVRGESMEPTLYDGDVIVIDTADTKPVDGAIYAINYEGEAVVKRMSRDAGDWWLTSDNPDQRKYHRKLCRGAECLLIGRVVRREGDLR